MLNLKLPLTVLLLAFWASARVLPAQELSTDFQTLAPNWLSRPAYRTVDFHSPVTTVRGQYEEPLESDRPDFTEASCTVGLGVLQIESGYTYTYDSAGGTATNQHDLPELLVRYGISDGVELRLGWIGYIFGRDENQTTGAATTNDGGTDLDVGLKIELTEQHGCWPEMAVITAVSAPSGAPAYSSNQVDPIVNLLYSWELSDRLSLGGSTAHRSTALLSDHYSQFAQSAVASLKLTEQWGSYFEWFAFFPHSSDDDRAEHYLDGGFTYLITPNFQVDWRVGLGLTEAADNFFTGAGFVIRR